MATELQRVLAFAAQLARYLRGEQEMDAATNHELRFYIFSEAYCAVRKHIPDFEPEQGTYVKIEAERTQRRSAPFPEAMRHIYAEITGIDEQLVRLIQMVVKDPDWRL